MTPEELRERITAWAVDVAHLVKPLFKNYDTRDRASQLKRAVDSTAINYRAACVARSHKEFLAKVSIALEEVDESVGWLELSSREGLLRGAELASALDEARQITRILAASRNTAQARENLSRKGSRH
ncbi:MAG: four helix bundle protein [Acidobacteriota bacterium]|nr:four helix bundle protein [Acidobacteriota bacterium]